MKGVSAFSTAPASPEGLYVLEGSVPPGSTGEGAYPLVFREQLPPTATHSMLKQMVRSPEACSQLITFHLTDKCAPLSQHEDLLFGFLGDVATAPYAGRDVDRGIALYATCYLAVHIHPAVSSSSASLWRSATTQKPTTATRT